MGRSHVSRDVDNRKVVTYPKNRKDNKKWKPKGFIWTYVIGSIIVCGGVMAFGLINTVMNEAGHHNPLNMLGMVPIMTLVYWLAMKPVIASISEKMERLAIAMEQVSEGNLDYQIELKSSGEYREVYSRFNAMTLELKKTKEEMESFTNEFAHEFKTPITAISGLSDYLLETADGIETEERIEQLQMISEESKRLLKLSMNTLLLSKVEATQVVSGKEQYDLAEQLRHCIVLLSKQMDEKNIVLDIDEDLTLPYYGNEEMLQHVWINLLNNAVKFTPKDGTISIKGITEQKEVVVCIKDNGIGMDQKTMDRIFDKYYQHDTVSLAKGSGIGLSIVKRIITLCGGSIDVKSAINEGSTFIVRLPVQG